MMIGFHLALRIGEVGNLEDRGISFGKVGGKPCIAIISDDPRTIHANLAFVGLL